jgi:tetratricopeptide (TPR) repeat protein
VANPLQTASAYAAGLSSSRVRAHKEDNSLSLNSDGFLLQLFLNRRRLFLNHLNLGGHVHIIADQPAACPQGYVPVEAEVLAAQPGAGAQASTLVAPGILALAETYLPSGQGERVIQWAERALPNVDAKRYPEACARVHYLLGAGSLISGRSLAEAEAHLLKAIDLAAENDLPEIAARSRLELGNLLAQRGDLTHALGAFEETIMLARTARERLLEILGHNNLAYHAQLAGDLATAREHIQTGLALAEARSFFLPRQYLYSTRGEIALAEGLPDEAEVWFKRALAEAEKYGNQLQAANIRANLGLVARARGDLEQALDLLETAQSAVAATSAARLQTQVDLWLAELHLQRGERAAAEESLTQAEARLAGGERRGLQAWAKRVRDGLHH